MNGTKVIYQDRAGTSVTAAYLRTRHKDQALGPITSIRIGRDPFYLSLAVGVGLSLFAFGFADLLYVHEQLGLALAGAATVGSGYAVASLQLGTHLHERTMLWGAYWRIRRIRNAIIEARAGYSPSPAMDTSEDLGGD